VSGRSPPGMSCNHVIHNQNQELIDCQLVNEDLVECVLVTMVMLLPLRLRRGSI
jgi:hypothetical protein